MEIIGAEDGGIAIFPLYLYSSDSKIAANRVRVVRKSLRLIRTEISDYKKFEYKSMRPKELQPIQSVEVSIFGETYNITGDASDTHQLTEVARKVDQQMKAIADSNPRFTRIQVAILTALNLSEEITRLEKSVEQNQRRMKDSTEKSNEISSPKDLTDVEVREILNRIQELTESLEQLNQYESVV